jgi:hypothetical protein
LTYSPIAGTILNAGTYTLSVAAAETDNYNEATKSVTIKVIYGFNGLLSPYAADKAYKIKSAIPLKWQYTNSSGGLCIPQQLTLWSRYSDLIPVSKLIYKQYF